MISKKISSNWPSILLVSSLSVNLSACNTAPDSLANKDILITIKHSESNTLPDGSYPSEGQIVKTFKDNGEVFTRVITGEHLQNFQGTYTYQRDNEYQGTETSHIPDLNNANYTTQYTFLDHNKGVWEENFNDLIHFKGTFTLRDTHIDIDNQGNIKKTIDIDGVQREYIAHFSPSFDPNALQPLIILLHGASATHQFTMDYTNLNTDIDRNNYVAIYPQSLMGVIPGTSNEILTWNPYFGHENDDVAFLSQLIDKAVSDYAVDPKRVYLIGYSNGGFMAHRMLCEARDKITSAAIVAAHLPIMATENCSSNRRYPLLTVHATNDHFVPYFESIPNYSLAAPEYLNYFSQQNQCDSTPETEDLPDINTEDKSRVIKLAYKNCQDRADLVHYKMVGKDGSTNHAWPNGTIELPELGSMNKDLTLNQVIIDFFKQYSLQ